MKGFENIWKFPGGLVDPEENLEIAVKREVFEETGIQTEIIGCMGFREVLNFRFGQGDIYFTFLVQALNDKIQMQDDEIAAAVWMDKVLSYN